MAVKSLKYFMREAAKKDVVVTVPGPSSILGDDGKPIELEIKILSNEEVAKISDMYRNHVRARDKKGNYIIQNGEIVFESDKDNAKAARHILVEALVYPNLKDPELMKFFDCVDITDMPFKVFPTTEEYGYINRKVLEVLGMIEPEEKQDEKDIDNAKN